jgi:hypothetical protein
MQDCYAFEVGDFRKLGRFEKLLDAAGVPAAMTTREEGK